MLTLKGSYFGRFDPFRVRNISLHSPWVSLRSPTAIKLDPFGIQKAIAWIPN
jgi:hypothetical protein